MLSTIEEADNQINCISYRNDGLQFVTGGSDVTVRIYDSLSSKTTLQLKSTDETVVHVSHSNRIFCAKFHPTDLNLIVSGGWDNTVKVRQLKDSEKIWDQRSGLAVRSIYGPHVCGEAIDIDDFGKTILTGSYTNNNALQVSILVFIFQVWDFASGKLISNVQWSETIDGESQKSSLLYSASFSRGTSSPVGSCNNRFIMAGGSNRNELKIFTSESYRVYIFM